MCALYIAYKEVYTRIASNELARRLGERRDRQYSRNEVYLAVAGLIGFLFGILLTYGTKYSHIASMFTAGLGMAGVETIRRIDERKRLVSKKRECCLIFESIELFMRTGMPMNKALADSLILTSELRPAITKALAYWNTGSYMALEILRKEINLPEGDTLVSLLRQLNQSGADSHDGILQRESHRLEQLRQSAERIRISKQPIVLNIYRALPTFVVLCIVAGTFLMRALSKMPFLN